MRHLLILLALVSCSFSYAQKRIVNVKSDIFQVKYSEELEQPLIVTYVVSCTETKFSRAGLDFYTNDSIHTSDANDYANNSYDKGHMAPAADFACDKRKLYETFSYLNCALQQQNLNRGIWRYLEAHERELAKTGKVEVTILVAFSKSSVKLPTGATIPDGFTKIIKHNGKTEKYYFPNIIPTKKSFSEYLLVNK